MKIVRGEKFARKKAVTMQLSVDVLEAIDKIASAKDIPRQTLIDAILRTAISSPDFTVSISTRD
jgi:predicted DNA binding CopG/RHH family protein